MALVYLPETSWSTRYGPEYFTVAIIGVQMDEESGGYAQYKLLVQNGKRHWTLLRRFSEFDRVLSCVPSRKDRQLPDLPPKTYCCRDLNPDFLARRKDLLQVFLSDLLVIPYVAETQAIRDFLQLQSAKTLFI